MKLILLFFLLLSGGATYYRYRSTGKYGRLVPAMLVILMVYLLFGRAHIH